MLKFSALVTRMCALGLKLSRKCNLYPMYSRVVSWVFSIIVLETNRVRLQDSQSMMHRKPIGWRPSVSSPLKFTVKRFVHLMEVWYHGDIELILSLLSFSIGINLGGKVGKIINHADDTTSGTRKIVVIYRVPFHLLFFTPNSSFIRRIVKEERSLITVQVWRYFFLSNWFETFSPFSTAHELNMQGNVLQ